MGAPKGRIPWNKGLNGFRKGYVPSEDHKRKIADALLGRIRPVEVGQKVSATRKDRISKGLIIPWNKGKKCPQISNAIKGDKHPMFGKVPWNKDKTGIYSDETIKKMSNARIGRYTGTDHPLYGKHCSDATKAKISRINKGKTPWNKGKKTGHTPWNKERTGCYSSETLLKWSEARKGNKAHNWKGGEKLARARKNNRRRELGTVQITKNNPFDEPIEYHHIHPSLPYVIPVPKRIHNMFKGKTHYDNINAFMGLKFPTLS